MSRPLPDAADRARRRQSDDELYPVVRGSGHHNARRDAFDWIGALSIDKVALCVAMVALAALLIYHGWFQR